MNIYYKWLSDSKSRSFDTDIDKIIDDITENDMWDDPREVKDICCLTNEVEIRAPRFFHIKTKDDKTVMDLFVDRMHIHVAKSKSTDICSVRIKADDSPWCCGVKDGNYDYGHPKNKYYEVYIKYRVPVINITEATGNRYEHGSWDKYVVKTMAILKDEIKSRTNWSIFNEIYKSKQNGNEDK
jgi:hypothetical protein